MTSYIHLNKSVLCDWKQHDLGDQRKQSCGTEEEEKEEVGGEHRGGAWI